MVENLNAAAKLNICERCTLLSDYTKVCNHYELFSEKDNENLTQLQDKAKSESTHQSKVENLKSITRTLEVLSSRRETGICILNSQFSAVLLPFVKGSLEKIFPSSGWACGSCIGVASPQVHSLIVISRALKYYLDIHTQYLVKGEKTFVYEIDESILEAVVNCFVTHGIELSVSKIKLQLREYLNKKENIRLLAIFMRIFADLIPLGIETYSQMVSGIMIKFIENLFGKCKSDI